MENFGKTPAYNLKLTLSYDQKLYKMISSQFSLAALVPNVSYPVEVKVESIDLTGTNDVIKIFIFNSASMLPVVGAIVNMPLSEINIE